MKGRQENGKGNRKETKMDIRGREKELERKGYQKVADVPP